MAAMSSSPEANAILPAGTQAFYFRINPEGNYRLGNMDAAKYAGPGGSAPLAGAQWTLAGSSAEEFEAGAGFAFPTPPRDAVQAWCEVVNLGSFALIEIDTGRDQLTANL